MAISIVFLSLTGMPALCVSGLLPHPCECGHEDCHNGASDCDDHVECEHEHDCPDDPCAGLAVSCQRPASDQILAAPPAVSSSVNIEPEVGRIAGPHTVQVGRPANRPFEPSDIPLLI